MADEGSGWGQAALLALQVIGKAVARKREEKQMRADALEQFLVQRAHDLGANTYGIQAAQFGKNLRREQHKPFMSPEELVQAYGAFKGSPKDTAQEDAAGRYPTMTPDDWASAQASRDEAQRATSTPDWVGLYPEDDPAFRERHGGI